MRVIAAAIILLFFYYAAAFNSAGLLSRSGGGIPGKNALAANARRDVHGADPDRRAASGGLRTMDAHLGFRRELAKIRQRFEAGCRGRGRQNKRDRRPGFANCSGSWSIIHDHRAGGTYDRSQPNLPRHWFPVRAVS